MTAQDGGRVPFSNATELEAWEAKWCRYCRHDHGMTHHDGCGDGCDLILAAMTDRSRLPEAWLDVPAGYGYHLPPHMLCLRFEPCTEGECAGDPHAETRVALVEQVRAAWEAPDGD